MNIKNLFIVIVVIAAAGMLLASLGVGTVIRHHIVFDYDHGIPFPWKAANHHIYLQQPNPDYYDYVVYVRSDVSMEDGEIFLSKLGFASNERGLSDALPDRDLPTQIIDWWIPSKNSAKIWVKRLNRNGYAQALLSEGRLYIFIIGDYRRLASVEKPASQDHFSKPR
jgi:hypothetical protein